MNVLDEAIMRAITPDLYNKKIILVVHKIMKKKKINQSIKNLLNPHAIQTHVSMVNSLIAKRPKMKINRCVTAFGNIKSSRIVIPSSKKQFPINENSFIGAYKQMIAI